jgi:hypothetical protein
VPGRPASETADVVAKMRALATSPESPPRDRYTDATIQRLVDPSRQCTRRATFEQGRVALLQ